MKKTNILYWVFTGLFAAVMTFTSIPNIILTEESVTVIAGLGYPVYIIPFLGIAKVLGAIALVVPGAPTIKEWAYAGFFFDLVGATYSSVMVHDLEPAMAGMLVFFGLHALSYIYYQKRRRNHGSLQQRTAVASV